MRGKIMNGRNEQAEREMLLKGVELASRALNALAKAGLITGFAIVVQEDADDFTAASCCPQHLALMVDGEIASQSDVPEVRFAVTRKAARELLDMFRDTSFEVRQSAHAAPMDEGEGAVPKDRQKAAEDAYSVLREVTGLPLRNFPGGES